jgi:molybdate transport system ATP-binding protein
VALARALAVGPRLVLLDEPFSALDAPAREGARRAVRRALAGLGIPTILVTHDRADVLATADRVVVMAGGRVRQVGTVTEVFGRPADSEVAAIVGVETVAEGRVVETREGIAAVEVGGARLTAVNPARLSGAVLVCIRAEEVVLRRDADRQDSARNHLSGRVAWLRPEGPLVRVGVECGMMLAAVVTRASCEELGLGEGAAVTALVKAPSVHLIAR